MAVTSGQGSARAKEMASARALGERWGVGRAHALDVASAAERAASLGRPWAVVWARVWAEAWAQAWVGELETMRGQNLALAMALGLGATTAEGSAHGSAGTLVRN